MMDLIFVIRQICEKIITNDKEIHRLRVLSTWKIRSTEYVEKTYGWPWPEKE